jgi:hypothetical protein
MVTSTMMSVQLLDKGFALSYGALITRIAKHFRVDMTGLREVQLEKGAMGVRFLNASQAHLREVEQEPRELAEHLLGWRSAWIASRLHSERHGRIYSKPSRRCSKLEPRIVPSWTGCTSTLWVLWTSETMASTTPVSVEVKGALGREGVLLPKGAQTREGALVREGRRCDHLQSRFQGDDPACSLVLIDVYLTRRLLFLFRLSPLRQWQFWMYFATA